MAAFWLPPDGGQKIVHLGSGSGSTMVCTLADDPVDFLRLLAIGYNEICWGSEFGAPPNADESFIVHPNVKYQQWVRETFSCDIPSTGMEIVRNPDVMEDKNPRDPFCKWVKENVA
jgi:hypothetical protein